MEIHMITKAGRINDRFAWFKKPEHLVENRRLQVTTAPKTDLWQGTYYDFRRDTGHCLMAEVKQDFSLIVRTEFFPRPQYDHCGLIVRANTGNWIKASTEYEVNGSSRIGSVVTNLGW